jgi:hypothetical protein
MASHHIVSHLLAFEVQSDLSFIFLASWKREVVPTVAFRPFIEDGLLFTAFMVQAVLRMA